MRLVKQYTAEEAVNIAPVLQLVSPVQAMRSAAAAGGGQVPGAASPCGCCWCLPLITTLISAGDLEHAVELPTNLREDLSFNIMEK